jgi:hypothetical protein
VQRGQHEDGEERGRQIDGEIPSAQERHQPAEIRVGQRPSQRGHQSLSRRWRHRRLGNGHEQLDPEGAARGADENQRGVGEATAVRQQPGPRIDESSAREAQDRAQSGGHQEALAKERA